MPDQANDAEPTSSQSKRKPTRRERFVEHIRLCSYADRWHLEQGYRRGSDSTREKIVNLLDSGKRGEAVDLAIGLIESADEPQPQVRHEPHLPEESIDGAADFIATHSGAEYTSAAIVKDPENYRSAYRQVASRLHPDASTGNEELYKLLGCAKGLLDQHHKLKGAIA
jgi:hypothetical protein